MSFNNHLSDLLASLPPSYLYQSKNQDKAPQVDVNQPCKSNLQFAAGEQDRHHKKRIKKYAEKTQDAHTSLKKETRTVFCKSNKRGTNYLVHTTQNFMSWL